MKDAAKEPVRDPPKSSRPARAAKTKDTEASKFRLTHPERVYWADVGVTKKDLAEYYLSVWDWISPHIVNRALAIVRCPDGTGGECFFQKHIAANVKSSPLRHAVAGKDHDVIAVETVDDLVALAQSGALEIHVRGSRLDSLETCDRIVFDLDPGEGVGWAQVVAAAREIRERLEAQKLESFVKLSGGKGVHVVAPIADVDWDTATLHIARQAQTVTGRGLLIDQPTKSDAGVRSVPLSERLVVELKQFDRGDGEHLRPSRSRTGRPGPNRPRRLLTTDHHGPDRHKLADQRVGPTFSRLQAHSSSPTDRPGDVPGHLDRTLPECTGSAASATLPFTGA